MNDLPLIERLKRARLIRVLGFYLGASWVLLQVVDVLEDALELPDWVAPVSLILLLIGLVIILATAMVQAGALSPVPAGQERGTGDAPAADGAAEVAGEAPFEAIDAPGVGAGLGRMLTWRRAILGGVMAFTAMFAIGFLVSRVTGVSPLGPEEAAADVAGVGLAVLPFSINGQDMDVWREGMVDLLAGNLDGAGGLRAIDPRTVMARWNDRVDEGETPDLATMLEVARSTGARYAVVGSAVALGDEVRMSTEVYDLVGEDGLGGGSVQGGTGQVMDLVDRLSVQTAGAVLATGGGDLPTLRHTTSLTTNSPEALRAYLQGESAYRAADFASASDAFRRAVSADSTFALANLRLSRSVGWLRSIGDEEGRAALEQATRFADRLPARDAELLRLEEMVERADTLAIGLARRAAQTYPDDPEFWEVYGEALYHSGSEMVYSAQETLEAFSRALELDPAFGPLYIHPLELLAGVADSAATYELLSQFEAHAFGEGEFALRKAFVDLQFGDEATRGAAIESLADADPLDLLTGYFYGFRRSARSAPGDLQMAGELRRRDQWVGTALLLEHSALLTTGRVEEALDLATSTAASNPGGAARQLFAISALGLDVGFSQVRGAFPGNEWGNGCATFGCFFGAVIAADAGDWQGYRQALDFQIETAEELRAQGEDGAFQADQELAWVAAGEAYGRWRRGEISDEEAFQAFRTVRSLQPYPNSGITQRNAAVRWWMAEILLEQGRFDEARRYYDSLWNTQWGAWFEVRNLGLGDAYRGMGDPAQAREKYEAFLEAWSEAPADNALVVRARSGLEALGS
jgi:tetratricopeptide (TPR) repeat protein